MVAGDWILTATGEWKEVDEAYDTGEWELVYNLRVADHHTYFVGDADWGWCAWAHNAYTRLFKVGDEILPTRIRNQAGLNLRPFAPLPSPSAPLPTPPVTITANVTTARNVVLGAINNIRSYMTKHFDSLETTAVAVISRNGIVEIWVAGSGADSDISKYRRQALYQTLAELGYTQNNAIYRIQNHHPNATTGPTGNHLDDAERHILRELTNQPGTELLAIGSTIPICQTCEPALASSGLAYSISVPTVSGNYLINPPEWTNIL